MFQAGQLRDEITIRRKSQTKNPDTGGLETGWSPVATVRAEVKSINGREALIGGVLQGISFFQITIRYRTDLLAADQVLWGARELNITAPPEDRLGTRQWTTIIASTQAPQGA